jgi:hypothetical protein
LGGLLGPAVVVVMGCGGETAGGGTGSTPEDESSGAGTTGTETGTTEPECIPLADVAMGTGGFAVDGESEGDYSGVSVSGAGDVNGDGIGDIIVGAFKADPNGADSGRAYVVFGKATTHKVSLADVTLGNGGFAMVGETEGDGSGRSVSGAGDVNGDGLDDVIVGAPWTDLWGDYAGRTYVVFGKGDTDEVSLADVAEGIGGFILDGEADGGLAGLSVSAAGDVDGDGLDDLIVGAPGADPDDRFDAGRTYVVLGKTDTDRVSLVGPAEGIGGFAMTGESLLDQSGRSVSGAGDVNGDGLADVIIGAPYASPNGDYSGRTYVVFGKADTTPWPLVAVPQGNGGFALDGEAENDHSGWSVSGAGDVNGDGFADVIVGAPTYYSTGRSYVVFGKTTTDKMDLSDVAQGMGGFALEGEALWDLSGLSVSGAGDVNGDGLADVIVGAPGSEPYGIDRPGRASVVFGKADTSMVSLTDVTQGFGGFTLNGEAEGDRAGLSVSGHGDINRDGLADLIVGAPYADPSGPYSGRTYVVFGGDFSCEGG